MDESAASKQGRKLSTMRVDPKARDVAHLTICAHCAEVSHVHEAT